VAVFVVSILNEGGMPETTTYSGEEEVFKLHVDFQDTKEDAEAAMRAIIEIGRMEQVVIAKSGDNPDKHLLEYLESLREDVFAQWAHVADD